MKKIFVLLFVFSLFSIPMNIDAELLDSHNFHVLLCQIDYNEDAGTFEISLKIFTDDLVGAINKANGKELVDISLNAKNADKYIYRYFVDKLDIMINESEQPLQLNYIGKETEFNTTWCYLESTNTIAIETVEIKCNAFMELYEDQVNIINLNKDNKQYGLTLHKGKITERLILSKQDN